MELGGREIPSWSLWAVGGVALLYALTKGKGTQSTGPSNEELSAEMNQRLQELYDVFNLRLANLTQVNPTPEPEPIPIGTGYLGPPVPIGNPGGLQPPPPGVPPWYLPPLGQDWGPGAGYIGPPLPEPHQPPPGSDGTATGTQPPDVIPPEPPGPDVTPPGFSMQTPPGSLPGTTSQPVINPMGSLMGMGGPAVEGMLTIGGINRVVYRNPFPNQALHSPYNTWVKTVKGYHLAE